MLVPQPTMHVPQTERLVLQPVMLVLQPVMLVLQPVMLVLQPEILVPPDLGGPANRTQKGHALPVPQLSVTAKKRSPAAPTPEPAGPKAPAPPQGGAHARTRRKSLPAVVTPDHVKIVKIAPQVREKTGRQVRQEDGLPLRARPEPPLPLPGKRAPNLAGPPKSAQPPNVARVLANSRHPRKKPANNCLIHSMPSEP